MIFWKNINEHYAVSNEGTVKSLKFDKEKVIKAYDNGRGYLQVKLYKDGKVEQQAYVHVLVAQAFLPNPNNYEVVHHINHNKLDNRVENLCWISEHEHDSMHGIEGNISRKKTVYQYTKDGLLVKVWESTMEPASEGFNGGAVAACCRNCYYTKQGNNIYKGYRWSYGNDRC